MRETTHSERFLQKQAPELMSATCTTQALAVFKTWPENRVGPAGDKAGSSHLSTARPGSGLPAAASNGPPPTQHTGSRQRARRLTATPSHFQRQGRCGGRWLSPLFPLGDNSPTGRLCGVGCGPRDAVRSQVPWFLFPPKLHNSPFS